MVTAFSREQEKKVYVQDKLREKADEVYKLINDDKANFYVCGDAARMAREVNDVLVDIISSKRGVTKQKAEDAVKSMRSSQQYQEDVWS